MIPKEISKRAQEELLRKLWLRTLPVLLKYNRVTVRIYNYPDLNSIQEEMAVVYGPQDRDQVEPISYVDIDVLLSDDPWTPTGFYTSVPLEGGGYIYTEDDLIFPGVIFQAVRSVNGVEELSRKYKVQDPESVGITQVVINKYKIYPLGD